MTKIKICGLTRKEDILYINQQKPDYIGFVFAPKSKRYVSKDAASKLKKLLDPQIQAAGVFVNAPIEEVAEIANENIIDVIQLHGSEDTEYIKKLKTYTDKKIIKAFSISSVEDLKKAEASKADEILLDHGKGGTGEIFDWNLLKNIQRPYFLAGGLSPENIELAIKENHPFAVDVSSGVETDGYKDFSKIETFITLIRKTENGEKQYGK